MSVGHGGGSSIMRGNVLAKNSHLKFHFLHLAFLVKKSAKNRNLHGNNKAFFHFGTQTICYADEDVWFFVISTYNS